MAKSDSSWSEGHLFVLCSLFRHVSPSFCNIVAFKDYFRREIIRGHEGKEIIIAKGTPFIFDAVKQITTAIVDGMIQATILGHVMFYIYWYNMLY